jgi:lipoic acid synthetase
LHETVFLIISKYVIYYHFALSMLIKRKPDWLKIRLAINYEYQNVKDIVQRHGLHTICQSGDCPNITECWGRGTATFMIMGNICTRACKFCNVVTGKPLPLDSEEPCRVAESIKIMGLKHVVVTSVDRDDLPDYGSSFWAQSIREIKLQNPDTTIEVLVPDFQGVNEYIQNIIDTKPNIISHNVETVRRLTPAIRTKAKYEISLRVIKTVSESGIPAKSGIMLGLGETEKEVIETMDDLLSAGCQIMTIGQYLQPSKENFPVIDYITPEQFEKFRLIGMDKGFKYVESAPLVRSSYHAEKQVN